MAGSPWKAVTESQGTRFIVARWNGRNMLELYDKPGTGAVSGSTMLLGKPFNCAVFREYSYALATANRLNDEGVQ